MQGCGEDSDMSRKGGDPLFEAALVLDESGTNKLHDIGKLGIVKAIGSDSILLNCYRVL